MVAAEPKLPLPPYHEALVAYLQAEEPETWAWFGSTESQASYAEALRLELLKQAYRLDAVAYPELFAAVTEAKAKLGLDVPVTLYQSQSNRELNATIYFLPGEAHIVFHGGVLQLLNASELRSVLGHELAHFILWSAADGKFALADRVAQAMANDPRASPSHVETARLVRLYTEIYADRGALLVAGDPAVVISGLVKISTGLPQVDAASYVRQADEIFSRSKVRTEELSHPEAFIRARAVMLSAEAAPGVEAEIERMIQGEASIGKLDLVGQQRFTALSQRWLRLFLEPAWFRTDAVRGHARMFFPDFAFAPAGHRDDALLETLRSGDLSVRDYFCYVLLDFAAVDPELELEPVRAGFALAAALGWDARFEALVVKELKLKKAEAQQLRAAVREAAASGAANRSETLT